MDLHIENRVAIITGASSGIGLATAELLASEGCHLILTDVDGTDWSECERCVEEAAGGRQPFRIVTADLNDAHDCRRLRDTAVNQFGSIHIVVHTAGITGAKGDPIEMSDEDYLEAYQIDFLSAVRIARECIPVMRENGWGRFVAITSENAVQPYWEEAVYNTAKAALACFVKGLSRNEAQHGILVNTVAPAFIATPMTDGMMHQRAEQEGVDFHEAVDTFLQQERPGIAMHRRGSPEEVAAVIGLLVSERASFINGANYRVDGGSVQTVDA